MANVSVDFLGMSFRNPIIPAAGPNVGTGEHLKAAAEGGAGGILAKTVSTKAAVVPRPDMYKFGPSGMLNTELWTELTLEQWEAVEYPIAREAAKALDIPFLASVGYSPDDLRAVGRRVQDAGAQAIEFSIHYLDPERIVETAQALRESVSVPIIAKLSPHSGDLGDLAAVLEPYVDGFACINSFGPTLAIDIDRCEPVLGSEFGYGWMSGSPLKPLALRSVFEVARRVSKPVIGVGGVTTAEDAVEMLMAGATLVGICTAAIYKGHGTYGRIAKGVSEWLDKHGYKDVSEIQGLYVKKYGRGQRVVTEFEEAPMVNADLCNGCTMCEKVCFYHAMKAPSKQVAVVDPELCFQCGLCRSVCVPKALSFTPRDQVTMRTES